jgi:hypothetical protein
VYVVKIIGIVSLKEKEAMEPVFISEFIYVISK